MARCIDWPKKSKQSEPETGWNSSNLADPASAACSTTAAKTAAVGEWAAKMVIAAKSNGRPRIKIRRRIHVAVVWVSAVHVAGRGVNVSGRSGVVVRGADPFGR